MIIHFTKLHRRKCFHAPSIHSSFSFLFWAVSYLRGYISEGSDKQRQRHNVRKWKAWYGTVKRDWGWDIGRGIRIKRIGKGGWKMKQEMRFKGSIKLEWNFGEFWLRVWDNWAKGVPFWYIKTNPLPRKQFFPYCIL